MSEQVMDIMKSLDPTSAMFPEIKYKPSLERKLTSREFAMNIYNNPDFPLQEMH